MEAKRRDPNIPAVLLLLEHSPVMSVGNSTKGEDDLQVPRGPRRDHPDLRMRSSAKMGSRNLDSTCITATAVARFQLNHTLPTHVVAGLVHSDCWWCR